MRANYIKSLVMLGVFTAATASAQTLINQGSYSSTSLVDTNSTSNSTSAVTTNNTSTSTSTNVNTSTVNSTSSNTNYNVNSGTMTYNNVQSGTLTNINQTTTNGTMTYNNNNVNSGSMTYNNNNVSTATNNNNNVSSSTATNVNQNIQSGEMTNINRNESNITQKLIQPPPTAIAPPMMSVGTDLCVTGVSGAAQTQIFGISMGSTKRDANCERLKISKTLYDMGMKVAAVATMCQDRRVWDAMMAAGTPCPYEGKIGEQARAAWTENPDKIPTIGLKE